MHRPKLARRARLRFDRLERRWVLLWPERGMFLNDTASAVVRLLDGSKTVEHIVDRLTAEFGAPRDRVAADVRALLDRIAARGLLEEAP